MVLCAGGRWRLFFTLEPVFENVFVVLPKMMKSFVSVQVFFEVRNWSFCFKWESPTVVYKSQFNFFPRSCKFKQDMFLCDRAKVVTTASNFFASGQFCGFSIPLWFFESYVVEKFRYRPRNCRSSPPDNLPMMCLPQQQLQWQKSLWRFSFDNKLFF